MIAAEQFRRRLMARSIEQGDGYVIITVDVEDTSYTYEMRWNNGNFDMSQVTRIEVDGQSIDISNTFPIASTIGEHTVKVFFDNLVDAGSMFYNLQWKETKDGNSVILFVYLDISNLRTNKIEDASDMFRGMFVRENLINGIEKMNTSNIVIMTRMFYQAFTSNVNFSLNLSQWDVSNVVDMTEMFYLYGIYSTYGLTSVNLSGWDTSNVVSMARMFYGCYALTELTMTGATNPNADVTDMFKDVGQTKSGTFYYNPAYDYSHIIAQLPSTWTAVQIS